MSLRDSCTLLCKGTTAGIIDGITTFLKSNGYTISNTCISEENGALTAHADKRSFRDLLKKPVPKLVDVVLKQENNNAVVYLRMVPFQKLQLYAHSLTLSMVGVTSSVFAIDCNLAKVHNISAGIWCLWAFTAAGLLTLAACYRSFDLLKVGPVLTGIRSNIEKRTGNASHIQGGIPGFQDLVLPVLVLLAALAIIAWDPDSWIMLVIVPLLVLMGIIYSKAGRMTRFLVGSYEFLTGLTFGIYSTMLLWSSPILKPQIKEQIGWCLRQDASLPMAVRDAFPQSWHPHAVVISRPLVAVMTTVMLFIIVVGVGGLVVQILGFGGPSAPKLVKNIEELRSRLRRASDNISREQRTFSFKFQSVVWVLCAPVNMFGIYLGLSSWDAAIFGTNQFFPMSLIEDARKGLNMLAAFFGGTHPGASWVPWFSRAILLVYGAPMVVLMGCLIIHGGRRCWSRFQMVRESARLLGSMPKDLLVEVRNIAEWAHVRMPYVRIVESTGISASTMIPLLPWGRSVVTLTKDSLNKLSNGELSGLLAHEIGHIKQRRSYIYQILSIMSRWTLFGNGWLLGGFDWFAAEYEADESALDWSQRKEGKEEGRIIVIGLLKRLQEQEIAHALVFIDDADRDRLMALGQSWLPGNLARKLVLYPKMNVWGKMWTVLAVRYYLLLGDSILAYCHPDLAQRIEKLHKV